MAADRVARLPLQWEELLQRYPRATYAGRLM